MARQRGVPSYCRHRASGQAVVRLDGVDHYLGRYGSPESHQAYERVIAEWRAQQAERAASGQSTLSGRNCNLTLAEVLLRYREFALGYLSCLAFFGQSSC